MKFLVVEDEFTTRLILQKILGEFGEVHIAANGREAVEAVKNSLQNKDPYRLITLDVVMSEMDGYEALKTIRNLETVFGVRHVDRTRVIMTTSLGDGKSIMTAFKEQCDGYLVKPIDRTELMKYLNENG